MTTLNTDMKIASWNVRGICNKATQKEAKKVIADEKLIEHLCNIRDSHE